MATYAGPWWRDGEAGEGFVNVVRGRITDEGPGPRAGAIPAVILDGVHNYHTHIGDAFLRGQPLPRGLEALVKPGTGYKHRMLSTAKASTLHAGVRRVLRDYAAAGTRSLVDFREQGIVGVGWARRIQESLGQDAPRVRLLGRPTRPATDSREMELLLERADGIGLPSLRDVGHDTLRVAAEACHRARKPLALHASEQRREPIDAVLEAEPDLLVHLNAATPGDLRRVADANVPVAACPTSNAYFRIRSQIRQLRRAHVRFHLGTDNAMLGSVDVLAEAREAKRQCPEIRDEELLRALTTPPEKAINRVRRVPSPTSGSGPLVVLPLRGRSVRWSAPPTVAQR